MKDLVIKGSVLKKELYILLGCFIAAFLLNIFSIAKFKTDWSELIGQLHIVVLFALFLFAVVFIIRWAIKGILSLLKK